jgi:hypothetical protein
VAIDLRAGPLFSMTYEVFYFFGVAIDFCVGLGCGCGHRQTIDQKNATRSPWFVARESLSNRPASRGFVVHIAHKTEVNINTGLLYHNSNAK